jgi:hypothetical protein
MPAPSPNKVGTNARRQNRKGATPVPATQAKAQNDRQGSTSAAPLDATEEIPICFICAEPVKFWSLSKCNHRTCHVCALRLRALYKRMDCTFCKVRSMHCLDFISSLRRKIKLLSYSHWILSSLSHHMYPMKYLSKTGSCLSILKLRR